MMQNHHQPEAPVPSRSARPSRTTAGKENPSAVWGIAPWRYQPKRGTDISGSPPAQNCPAGGAGRVVFGAKRSRSLYLPLVRERLPRLSTASPPKDPASLSTINAATTPWRGALAQQTSLPRITQSQLVAPPTRHPPAPRLLGDQLRWSPGRRVTRGVYKLLASLASSRYNPFRCAGSNGRPAPDACVRGKAYE